jgi:integrase
MRFLEQQETREADGVESADLTSASLASAATLYFDWKLANNSPETVSRERRMFKNVLKFFGPQTAVRCIRLPQIRAYQKNRCQQISPTMKQPVTARSVNYEMQLLKGVMSYADCWSETLAARYQPLREVKSRAGKTAGTDQMIKIINTAKDNEYWEVAMWCGAVGAGTGCRSGEVRKLQLKDICLLEGKIRVQSLHPIPLTTYLGSQDWPSFSRDGSQVTFSWDGEKQRHVVSRWLPSVEEDSGRFFIAVQQWWSAKHRDDNRWVLPPRS